MYFRILNREDSGELTYLLADSTARQAVLIDPHGRDLPLLSALLAERDLQLRWVLRTHHHDGTQQSEAKMLQTLGGALVQGDRTGFVLDEVDGTVLTFGDEVVRVIRTPGHTSYCLSFAWRDRLFCGGLLAVNDCPRQRQPQEPETLWESVMRKVFTLPDETLLFPGYARSGRAVTTVLEQRHWHPFFATLARDEFLTQMRAPAEVGPREPVFEE